MESIDNLKRKIESSIERYYEGHVILFPFLDENNSVVFENICKLNHVDFYKYGKITNSDRKRYIMSNYDVKNEDFKIVVYKVIYNKKYYDINHRNVLGSLMGLGIKRETIGDIIIDDNKDVYFAATEEISKFIENDFKFIGKAPIELIRFNDEVINVIKYDSKEYILSSLRVDCVIAGIYKLSRSEAQQKIFEGDLSINHQQNQNISYNLNVGDVVSLRGYGKFKVGALSGKTRSDRLKVILEKRV